MCTYHVLATGPNEGLIEVVPDAHNVAKVSRRLFLVSLCLLSVCLSFCLSAFLSHVPSTLRSTASSCVVLLCSRTRLLISVTGLSRMPLVSSLSCSLYCAMCPMS
jgi:hypothetical protein